jgi:quinol monooxygenase YgiN
MIHKIVHYKVKADKLDLALPAIQTFVQAIRAGEPRTFYEAYQHKDDPTLFVHTMSFPDEASEKYHQTSAHTQAFVQVLYPNCEPPPKFTDLSLVESTTNRFLGDSSSR